MSSLLPWLIVMLTLVAAFPTAYFLVNRNPQAVNPALAITLTPGFTVGAITLIMFWSALLHRQIALTETLLLYVVFMLPGWVWIIRDLRMNPQPYQWERPHILGLPLILIASAILFNGIQWPFYTQDALGIYATQAHWLYETRLLIPLELSFFSYYQAYPMGVPLTYAFSYMAAGWEHEYLANGLVTLLGVSCIGAVYTIGYSLFNKRIGLIAALLLAFTPSFVRWASSGYVDLPTAYFYTLGVLFCWRLLHQSHWSDAILAGLCIGLAAWMKNAALFGIGLYGLWLLVQCLITRKVRLNLLLISLAACCAVAAPWYIRNALSLSILIPDTAWTDQAQPNLETLLIFVLRPENYAITGILILLGLASTVPLLMRRTAPVHNTHLLLVWFTLPYFGIWWLLVSYDPRFILLIIPLLCVIAAWAVEQGWNRLSATQQKRLQSPLLIGVIVLTLYHLWIAVDYKQALLANPLMDHPTKLEVVGR